MIGKLNASHPLLFKSAPGRPLAIAHVQRLAVFISFRAISLMKQQGGTGKEGKISCSIEIVEETTTS
jgi:hypothetical protein